MLIFQFTHIEDCNHYHMSQNMLIQDAKGQADFISCLNQGNL